MLGLRCGPASRRKCLSGLASSRLFALVLRAALPAAFLFAAHVRAQEPPEDPVALVRAASWNELHATNKDIPSASVCASRMRTGHHQRHHRNQRRRHRTPGSRRGQAAHAGARPGGACSARQPARSSGAAGASQKKEKEDSNRENEMVRLLPDAFLYTYRGIAQTPSGPAWRPQLPAQ